MLLFRLSSRLFLVTYMDCEASHEGSPTTSSSYNQLTRIIYPITEFQLWIPAYDMSRINEASLMGLPREIRDQILECLLPNNQSIDVKREPRRVWYPNLRHYHEFYDERASLRHEDEACHPTILQTCHQLNAEGSRIMYNRAFHLRIDGGAERGHRYGAINFVNNMWPSAFEQFRFQYAKAKEIQLDLVAESDSNMPLFLINLAAVCKRLDKERSLRNVRINFLDPVPQFANGNAWYWSGLENEASHVREHIELVLQHLAQLRNVCQAKVVLPEKLRDDSELQSLVRDCENAMMTARPVRDHAVKIGRLRRYTWPKPRRTLLDRAGFDASFYQEQNKRVVMPASVKNRSLRNGIDSDITFHRFMSRCREHTGGPEPQRTLLDQAGFGSSFYHEQ